MRCSRARLLRSWPSQLMDVFEEMLFHLGLEPDCVVLGMVRHTAGPHTSQRCSPHKALRRPQAVTTLGFLSGAFRQARRRAYSPPAVHHPLTILSTDLGKASNRVLTCGSLLAQP